MIPNSLERAKLPHFRIHDMRHTFGTIAVSKGVDVRTVQELMGHSSIRTTIIYLHAAPNRMREAVAELGLDGSISKKADNISTG
jgi:site-specific recombinase XerD